MSSSDALSISANLASSVASLVDEPYQPSPIGQVNLSNLPPVFIELNGTLVNLRDISLIRKAKDRSYCFVIYLKTGTRCETGTYNYHTEYMRDWDRIVAAIKSL